MKKEHTTKCKSLSPKYYGEARQQHLNPDWDAMGECNCDGYHTFDELYEHRIVLWIALCRVIKNGNVWRSKLHSDGTSFEGWFVLGIWFAKGSQVTYHLPLSKWNETEFAQTLEKAPEFDGHTSDDVLERIKSL